MYIGQNRHLDLSPSRNLDDRGRTAAKSRDQIEPSWWVAREIKKSAKLLTYQQMGQEKKSHQDDESLHNFSHFNPWNELFHLPQRHKSAFPSVLPGWHLRGPLQIFYHHSFDFINRARQLLLIFNWAWIIGCLIGRNRYSLLWRLSRRKWSRKGRCLHWITNCARWLLYILSRIQIIGC